jgi:hypothetical protein
MVKRHPLVEDQLNQSHLVVIVAIHREAAVNEIGMFGNRNTVCKPMTPKWRPTVNRLRERGRGC